MKENIAYTRRYQEEQAKYQNIIVDVNFKRDETRYLIGGVTIQKKYYERLDNVGNYDYVQRAAHVDIFYKGQLVYSHDNLLDHGRLIVPQIINHQNGYHYMVFTTGLYGYSVLNLDTKTVKHFIPKESLDEGEAFIWVAGYYNSTENLLVVDGCYWASPYSVIVVDFSNPEALPLNEIEMSNIIGAATGSNVVCDEIEYLGWKETLLTVKAKVCSTMDATLHSNRLFHFTADELKKYVKDDYAPVGAYL